MKRSILTGTLLLIACACAGSAQAQGGINLSWSDCGLFGSPIRQWACSNNAVAGVLFVSAVPPVDMPQFNSAEASIAIQLNATELSPWWHMETGGCRANAWVASGDFLANTHCSDPWNGEAVGGQAYSINNFGLNSARLRGVLAVATARPITADREWYVMKFILQGTKTVGTSSCAGCLDGACLVLERVTLYQPLGVGDHTVSQPIYDSRATWQVSGTVFPNGCPFFTESRSRTWGSVKALYR